MLISLAIKEIQITTTMSKMAQLLWTTVAAP